MFNYGNAEKAIEQNRDLKDENEMLSRQAREGAVSFYPVSFLFSSSSFTALPTSTRWSTSGPLARGPCGMERAAMYISRACLSAGREGRLRCSCSRKVCAALLQASRATRARAGGKRRVEGHE